MKLTDFRTLGRSGLRVSPLCLGTMTFGSEWGSFGADPATSHAMMDRYVELGGNFLDTANMYIGGRSEEIVGDYLTASSGRDRLVIGSKFGTSMVPGDPNGGGAGRKNIISACEQSLRRLKTDYLDLYWLHWWDRITPVEETMQAMDDLVRSGKVRYIGFSDVPAWKVVEAQMLARFRGWVPLIAIQVEHSLLERTVEGELLPMADAHGMGVTVWSPLRSGILTGKYGRNEQIVGQSPRDQVVRNLLDERAHTVIDAVKAIAAELDATPAGVALAWLLARPGVTSPIIGARTIEQLDGNLACLDVRLSEENMAMLDEISRPNLNFPHDLNLMNMGMSYPGMSIDGRAYGATDLVR